MKNKKFIKFGSISLAVIFFIGILISSIGHVIVNREATSKRDNKRIVHNLEKKYEDIDEINKNIKMYLRDIDNKKDNALSIFELAKQYEHLGDIYNKRDNKQKKEESYSNSIKYYKILLNKDLKYFNISKYKIIELKNKLGFFIESELLLSEFLKKEKNNNIIISVYINYGIHWKKYFKNNKKAQIFFDKAISVAKNEKEKKIIKDYLKEI